MALDDPVDSKGFGALALVANDDLCNQIPDPTLCCVTGKQHELKPRSWTFFVAPG